MALAWENNKNGICEDAPCCGCCGPHGDGQFDPGEPPENDSYDDYLFERDLDHMDEEDEEYNERIEGESPDPHWMND